MNNLNSVQSLNTFEYMDIDINEEYDDAFPCDDDITFEYDYKAFERTQAEFELSEDDESDVEASYLDSPSTIISNETDFFRNQEQNSTCVLIDLIDGKIQACGSDKKIRPLTQLIGMWNQIRIL